MVISTFSGCTTSSGGTQTTATGAMISTSKVKASSVISSSTVKTASTVKLSTASKVPSTNAETTSQTDMSTSDTLSESEVMTDDRDVSQKSEEIDQTDSSGNAVEKVYDLKGRVLKVIASSKDAFMWPIEDGTRQGEVRTKMVREAEEKYNCKFEFELFKSWAILDRDVVNAVMAGINYCDIFRMIRSTAMPKYEKMNTILSLNDYVDFSQPVYQKYDQINGVLYPDKIYAFYICTPLTPIGVFYNRDILERNGIQDIQNLDTEGNWTWNAFIDIAVRTTQDIDGDGIIDQWGVGSDNAAALCIALMRSNLAAMVDRNTAGEYVYNLQNPKALKALQFVSDLYFTYRVAKVASVLTDFNNGKAAMYVKDAWYGAYLRKGQNLGFEIIPDGPDNPGDAYMREQGSHMYFFPANLVDPEPVINATAHWNVLWDDRKSDYLTDEDMVVSQAKVYFDYNETNVNNFLDMIKNRKIQYDYVEYFETTGKVKTIMTSNVFLKIASEPVAPMHNIDAIKLQCQELINEAMVK